MAKLTREQKIELYKKRKQGETVSSLSKEYQIRSDNGTMSRKSTS